MDRLVCSNISVLELVIIKISVKKYKVPIHNMDWMGAKSAKGRAVRDTC